MSTPNITITNRPAGKPVFDFNITQGLCRVELVTVSNDGQTLVLSGWGFRIDSEGQPMLSAATASPIATMDSIRTVELSGILAGTRSLYDGWCKYAPDSQTTIDAASLPDGWTSGSTGPTGTPAYGTGYYDTASDQGWTYQQGCLNAQAKAIADALEAQIDTAQKLATLGL